MSKLQYDLGDKRFIKQFDARNWVVRELKVKDEGDNIGDEYEIIHGYYPTLQSAKRGAFRTFSLAEGTHKKLEDLIKKIESL